MPAALTIELEIEIGAPPEKVWKVFSCAEGMKYWLGMDGYHPNIGAEYIMHVSAPDGKFDFFGEVIIYDPPRELAFSWIQQKEGKQPWPTSTLVTLRLEKISGGTLVKLVHSGFEKLPTPREEYDGHVDGWERSQALAGLKEMLESEQPVEQILAEVKLEAGS